MINVNEEKLEEFSKALIQAYKEENKNELEPIVSILEHSSDEKSIEFMQIGRRVNLPEDMFSNDVDTKSLARQFARHVIIAEKNFLLTQIKKLSDIEAVKKIKLDSYEYGELVTKIMRNVALPTDIYIPLRSKFFELMLDWLKAHHIRYVGKDPILSAGNHEIKIHWIQEKILNSIVVIDRNNVNLVI